MFPEYRKWKNEEFNHFATKENLNMMRKSVRDSHRTLIVARLSLVVSVAALVVAIAALLK